MGFFELEVSTKSADQHSLAAVLVGLAVHGDVLGRLASASGPGVTSVYLKVRFWMPWGSTLDCFVERLFVALRPMTCRLLQPVSPSIRRFLELQKLNAWPSLDPREKRSQFSRPGSVPGPLGCHPAALS